MDEFQINWSNDSIKSPVIVEAYDRVTDACSLSLYGKGAPNYGEGLQENLLRLMENFCSDVAPPHPTKGQLWFDVNADTLQVYNGATWTPISGLGSGAVSTQPAGDNDVSVATTAFVQTAIAGKITKNVSNMPLVALTQIEAGNGIIELTGTLNSTTNVIVPAGVSKKWLIRNSTSGSHDLIVKTNSGTGVTIPQNKTIFVYSDAINVHTIDIDVLSQVIDDGGSGSGIDADLLDGQQGSFYAPITSPNFTGTPLGPTAAVGTNTAQLATTAFVATAIQNSTSSVTLGTDANDLKMDGTASAGTKTTAAKSDHVHPTDTSRAPIASPAFTGVPTGPTATVGTNTSQLATTAFVAAAVSGVSGGGGPTLSFETTSSNIKANGAASAGTLSTVPRADHIHPTDSTRAPVESPNFTGTPTGPTATAGTNTTQLATTAFVTNAVNVSLNLNNNAALIASNGISNAGTSSSVARADHVHPTDTTRAPLASPFFTGTPSAPTAAPGTNTTQIATTAFVAAAIGGGGGGGGGGSLNSTNSVIAMNGFQSAGTATTAARADHVHPNDTTRASLVETNTFTNVNTFSSTQASNFKVPPTITNPSNIYSSSNNSVATIANALGIASGNGSLGAIGFKTFPGGFIIEWGWYTIQSNTAGVATLTVPMTFPTVAVSASLLPSWNITVSLYQIARTYISFNHPANCQGMTVYVIMIGY